jgi:beta-galactosidase
VLARTEAAHRQNPHAPTRTGGEMGLFLPFAYRATSMEALADTQTQYGSFYPSIHFVWHFGEVNYEVARAIYMQASFAADMFKGGWTGAWESTGGPQQMSGSKGWGLEDGGTIPGFTVNAGTMTQLFLSYLAGGFRGAGVWTWNYRRAGIEGGEYALVNRQMEPSPRAVRAGAIARAAEALRDEIWQARKEPYVGVLYNWDSEAIWAANSVRNRDLFRHYPMRARVGVSRALINGNIPWEHVLPSDIEKGLARRYKVIYLPAQLALDNRLLERLIEFASAGGRVVLDAPGGWYDERGLVFDTGAGSAFERLFGVSIADFQYSNNVPRTLDGQKMNGFILELKPSSAKVLASFQTGEPAVTENRIGKGSSVVMAFDAAYAAFRPGNTWMEERLRRYTMGSIRSPYGCEGAVVYRIAAPAADHYFFINDGEPTRVMLDTRAYKYHSVSDPVSGEKLRLGQPIELEGYSGRWLRFAKQ